MLYEYALISVAIACGYWGWFFVRRQPMGSPTYGIMQLATAALAGLGLYGRHAPSKLLGIAGAVGCGAGACLLIVAPLVRGLARRFAAAERLGIAGRLLDLADVLAPGSGAAEEKGVLASMADIRDGKVEPTVAALAAAKRDASPEARHAIDERIALLYLAAYRWTDAIRHAEANLLTPPEVAAARSPLGVRGSLRDELGMAPPVWVELLGAYGRTGNLDQTARMVAKLEDACEGRPDASIWIDRGRLMFLALAGRPAAVRALVDGNRAQHMSAAARTYWVAVALEHQGDRTAAEAAYQQARGRSKGRPRDMIDRAIANLPDVTPAALSPLATDIVTRVEAAPLPAPIRVARASQRPWATWVLTAIPIAVYLTAVATVGPSAEPGTLVRSGAMVRGFVDAGEWWRVISCVMVHVGAVHLGVNTIGLWFLGRTTEDLFGPARTIVIFSVAGIGGAVASYLAAPAGLSAGASGAVFGLLGAMFVELTWHRERYRAAWKRGMWGGIVVVTIAQLGVGFVYPVVDCWAHGIGLVGGLVAGALLSPHAPWRKVGRALARGLAIALGGLALATVILVVRTPVVQSFEDQRVARRSIDGVNITAPARWEYEAALVDPDGLVIVDLHAERRGDLGTQRRAWAERAVKLAAVRDLPHVAVAATPRFVLPPGWEGGELEGAIEDELGNRQPFRLLVCTREAGDTLLELVIMAPESVVTAAPTFFTQLVASAQPD